MPSADFYHCILINQASGLCNPYNRRLSLIYSQTLCLFNCLHFAHVDYHRATSHPRQLFSETGSYNQGPGLMRHQDSQTKAEKEGF